MKEASKNGRDTKIPERLIDIFTFNKEQMKQKALNRRNDELLGPENETVPDQIDILADKSEIQELKEEKTAQSRKRPLEASKESFSLQRKNIKLTPEDLDAEDHRNIQKVALN